MYVHMLLTHQPESFSFDDGLQLKIAHRRLENANSQQSTSSIQRHIYAYQLINTPRARNAFPSVGRTA